jgi:hypothetical protein
MSDMDVLKLREALDKFNAETLPELRHLLEKTVADLDAIVSRLDGLVITINLAKKEIKPCEPS